LGLSYANGRGVPQDDNEAVKWFIKAAEQGDPKAQFFSGLMHTIGRGVPQDDNEAVKWYAKAAEQGNADAQFFMGLMYEEGKGVHRDDEEAAKYYALAAEQGHADAQESLALMKVEGYGVQSDDNQLVSKVIAPNNSGSNDEVADFFLSNSPGHTKEHFYRFVLEDMCFFPLWESALARSKGETSYFDHAKCREKNQPYSESYAQSQRPAYEVYSQSQQILASGSRESTGRRKDKPSTAQSTANVRRAASKTSSPSFLERLVWAYVEHEIDCKIGECAERRRLLRDVEAAAARGAARGARSRSAQDQAMRNVRKMHCNNNKGNKYSISRDC
jgi:hypothetical protein